MIARILTQNDYKFEVSPKFPNQVAILDCSSLYPFVKNAEQFVPGPREGGREGGRAGGREGGREGRRWMEGMHSTE